MRFAFSDCDPDHQVISIWILHFRSTIVTKFPWKSLAGGFYLVAKYDAGRSCFVLEKIFQKKIEFHIMIAERHV